MFSIFNKPRIYPSVYEPYSHAFNFYDGRDAWLESISDIPTKAVHLFCVHWLHLEVYNGGFWQYFYNSSATMAPEARDGFVAIGMDDVAIIVQDAMARLGNPFPFEKSVRERIAGGPSNRMDFSTEDQAFYGLADTEKLFRRTPRFVSFADAYAQKDGS